MGKIIVSKGGVVVKEIDAVLAEELQAMSYFDTIKKIGECWR